MSGAGASSFSRDGGRERAPPAEILSEAKDLFCEAIAKIAESAKKLEVLSDSSMPRGAVRGSTNPEKAKPSSFG